MKQECIVGWSYEEMERLVNGRLDGWQSLNLSVIHAFKQIINCNLSESNFSSIFLSSGGSLSPVGGHCGSEPGAYGDPSGEGEPDQTGQVHDPNGSVLCALPGPLVDCDWLLPVRTHLPEHLGENMDGGKLQELSHPLPIQGRERERERGESVCVVMLLILCLYLTHNHTYVIEINKCMVLQLNKLWIHRHICKNGPITFF